MNDELETLESRSSSPKRVVMLSTDHLIIDRRIMQEAKSLTGKGYEVTVLSGFECPREEHYISEGVSVHRYCFDGCNKEADQNTGSSPYKSGWLIMKGFLKRTLLRYYIFRRMKDFLKSSIDNLKRSVSGQNKAGMSPQQVFESYVEDLAAHFPSDIVHVHDLPLLWLGVKLAERWKAKLVYDAHEIYYVYHSFLPEIKEKMKLDELAFVKRVDLFITVNEFIAQHFESIHNKRPLVLLNAIDRNSELDEVEGRRILREKMGVPQESIVVLYQGWFSIERNIRTLVQSAEYFPDNAYLAVVGYGEYETVLRSAIGEKWSHKVKFLGRIEPEDLPAITIGADLGVIPYQPVDINHHLCSPNKFFEYVQAGVPIIAHCLPFFKDMAEKYGVVCARDLSTVSGMEKAINCVIRDSKKLQTMRDACKEAREKLTWGIEESKLIDAYARL